MHQERQCHNFYTAETSMNFIRDYFQTKLKIEWQIMTLTYLNSKGFFSKVDT